MNLLLSHFQLNLSLFIEDCSSRYIYDFRLPIRVEEICFGRVLAGPNCRRLRQVQVSSAARADLRQKLRRLH